MSELSEKLTKAGEKLAKARALQICARYAAHYEEQDNFIIEGQYPNLVQIVVKPDEAADLLGDLLKYVFSNCKQRGEFELGGNMPTVYGVSVKKLDNTEKSRQNVMR